jgi:hypothetical protein
MTETTVTPEIHQPLERCLNLSAQVSLYLLTTLDNLTNLVDLLLGEVISASAHVDAGLGQDHLRLVEPYTVNVRESANDTLVTRKIYTCNTWHALTPNY